MQKERFEHIDLLKTFAIICVVFIHCFSLEFDIWNGGTLIKCIGY